MLLTLLLAAVLLPAASAVADPSARPVPGATAGTACPKGTVPRAGAPADPTNPAKNLGPPEWHDARGGCVPKSADGCKALNLSGPDYYKCEKEVKDAECEDNLESWVPGGEDICKDRVAREIKDECKNAGASHCDDSSGLGLADALKDPVSSVASSGFDAASKKFAGAAKWLAGQIGKILFDSSAIDLDSDSVADVNGPMLRLSLTFAVILLCLQVTRTCLTSDGTGFAVAATGLVKWSLTSLAFYTVTQEAIWASDEISRWLISTSSYQTEAGFTLKLTAVFASLDFVSDSALVLLVAFFGCVVALALWVEMKFRHAALDILVATSPMSAVGALSEGTKEWAPTARKATITIIGIKPVIVIIFLLGSHQFGQSKDLDGAIVGVLIIGLGAVAWPVVARFMPFAGGGAGSSFMGGLVGAVGGTAASAMWSRGGGTPTGAGAVPPGAGLAQAMESNDSAGQTRTAPGSRGGRAVMAGLMAAQLTKAGTDQLSGGMAAMAAHAGLGPGQDMGGVISLPPSRGGSAPAGGTGGTDQADSPTPGAPGGTGPRRPTPGGTPPAPARPPRTRTTVTVNTDVRLNPSSPGAGSPGAAPTRPTAAPTAPPTVPLPAVPPPATPPPPPPVPLPDDPFDERS